MIKKISFAAAMFAVVALASCSGNKTATADSDSIAPETGIVVEEEVVANDSETGVAVAAEEVVVDSPAAQK